MGLFFTNLHPSQQLLNTILDQVKRVVILDSVAQVLINDHHNVLLALLPEAGYDNPTVTRSRGRRKWGSILNLAENGDPELTNKHFFKIFLFLFFRFLADCGPKWGKSEEKGIYLRGWGAKKVHRKFWLEKSRPQTFEILS